MSSFCPNRLRHGLRLVALGLLLASPWPVQAGEVAGLRTALAAAGAEDWAAATAAAVAEDDVEAVASGGPSATLLEESQSTCFSP